MGKEGVSIFYMLRGERIISVQMAGDLMIWR